MAVGSALVEKREQLASVQLKAAEFWSKHDDLVVSDAEIEEAKRFDAELNDLQKEVEQLVDLDLKRRAVQTAGEFVGQPGQQQQESKGGLPYPLPGVSGQDGGYGLGYAASQKSIGRLWIESDGFKNYSQSSKHGPESTFPLEVVLGAKATLTETGYAPQAVRIPTIVPTALQRPTISDLVPGGRTDQIAVVYMEETTATNAAAVTDQAAAKPESALAFTERTATVRKIATFLPVTDELTQDVPAMQSYIDGRLRLFVQIAEDSELVSGDGTGVHLVGFLHATNLQTQAKGSDSIITAIAKAMANIYTSTFLPASGIVMHPLDWVTVRTYQETTGGYVMASPADPNYTDRLWGLPVIQTTAMPQHTALVGAFDSCAQIFRKQDLVMEMSNSHQDFFQKNLIAIRAEERLAMAIFRGAGFSQVTGI